MGCAFSQPKEPADGIYLEVHDLKDLDEVPELATQSSIKNPVQNFSSGDPNRTQNNHSSDPNDNEDPKLSNGEVSRVSRACSFTKKTSVIEFNPKKSINVYLPYDGSLHDSDSEVGSLNEYAEDLGFENKNFKEYYPEEDEDVDDKAHSQSPEHTNQGHRRSSCDKGQDVTKGQEVAKGQDVMTHYEQGHASQGHHADRRSSWDRRLHHGERSSGHKGEFKHSVSDLHPDDIINSAGDEPKYHTRRRISAINLGPITSDDLNALDGLHHSAAPNHNSHQEHRLSASVSFEARRLSAQLTSKINLFAH